MANQTKPTRNRPARTPEGRQQQMIGYAMDLAEQQLIEGTASSQVITHFLKLGSLKTQLELEKLRHENQLMEAKTKALESATNQEEIYKAAVEAMQRYTGSAHVDE